ncbi:MAG: hypothetical protein U0Y68_24510 [Blastocatellia bacterium]
MKSALISMNARLIRKCHTTAKSGQFIVDERWGRADRPLNSVLSYRFSLAQSLFFWLTCSLITWDRIGACLQVNLRTQSTQQQEAIWFLRLQTRKTSKTGVRNSLRRQHIADNQAISPANTTPSLQGAMLWRAV